MSETKNNIPIFDKINKFIKEKRKPEKRLIRHTYESEIINHIFASLADSEMGRVLLNFVDDHVIDIMILRGRNTINFSMVKNALHLGVSSRTAIDDPEITIHMIGSIRETMHEYDPQLRRLGVDHSESVYVMREEQKYEDKLFWQTGVVYELGQAGKQEFVDAWIYMGYGSLLEAYERDIKNG